MRKVVDKKITYENSLTSTAVDKGLAAAQGKALEDGKVDKVVGKGLSAQDFTDADHSKLDGIASGAQVNPNDAAITASYNSEVAQVSSSERTAGTETGIRRYAPADVASIAAQHGSYTLPTASSSTLGGVKVGSTLEIDSGVLNVTGLVYNSYSSSSSNATLYTNSSDGYIFKWNASASQITVACSNQSYMEAASEKVDGGSSSPTVRRNTNDLSTSGSSDYFFTGSTTKDADWDMEAGASFKSIITPWSSAAAGYKIEALKTNGYVYVQIWRIA